MWHPRLIRGRRNGITRHGSMQRAQEHQGWGQARGSPRSSAARELGLQAVEDGLEAELEAGLGGRPVTGRGCAEAGTQPGEPGADLADFGHAGAEAFAAVGAVAAESP